MQKSPDQSINTTRQSLEQDDTAKSDDFAPLNTSQSDKENDLALRLDPPTTVSVNSVPTESNNLITLATNPNSLNSESLSKGSMESENQKNSGLGSISESKKLTSKLEPASNVNSGPPTTHYHNFFYDTFSWKYPRTTGMLFTGSLAFLLLGHFVNILRYTFKGAYIAFAVTAAFEYLGRLTTSTGFISQLRPAKYYTIPRAQLENVFAEMHEFLNFVVLEFQRILFAENLSVTVSAFAFSYIGFVLIKFLPVWGLVLLADIALFTLPLVYIQNQEVIDHHMNHASSVVNEQLQTAQNLAAKHTADITDKARAMSVDLSEKVSNVYQGRQASTTVAGQNATSAPLPTPPGPAPTSIEPIVI